MAKSFLLSQHQYAGTWDAIMGARPSQGKYNNDKIFEGLLKT